MYLEGYDSWKLDNNEHEFEYCEHCESKELELEEIKYIDADGGTGVLFLCHRCIDNEIWL